MRRGKPPRHVSVSASRRVQDRPIDRRQHTIRGVIRGRSLLGIPESAALVLAAIVAYAYYFAWLDVPVLHDAAGYLRAGHDIANHGLFTKYDVSDLRTYVWPLVLSGFVRLCDWTGLSIRLVVFCFNLTCWLASCLVLRRAFLTTGASLRLARLGFLAIVLNPLLLIYPSYLLTESLSFSLIVVLVAVCVFIVSPAGQARFQWLTAVGSLLLGIAIMTRPGTLALAPVWCAAVLFGFIRHRPSLKVLVSASVLGVVLLAAPMVPQFINNVRFYGRWTPLLADDFSQRGRWFGVRYIKHATASIGTLRPEVMYENPLYGGEPLSEESPLAWYWQHPFKGAATTALHIFNMLDQDLPFPYNTTLVPTYYPAAAIANMFVVGCGLIGVFVAGRAVRASAEARPYYLLALIMMASQVGMHMLFAIETRWGVPLLMVLYVLATFLVASWLPAAPPARRIAAILGAGAIAAASFPLSQWVRQQAPQIRAAISRPYDEQFVPAIMASIVPGRAFVSSNLKEWSLVNGGVGTDDEAILASPRSGEISELWHHVSLEPNAEYRVEFDARAVAPVTAELSVDLYADAYDHAAQNSVFPTFEKTYTHFTAQWNSGSDAPPQADLRFVTLSKDPIQIQHIVFTKVVPR